MIGIHGHHAAQKKLDAAPRYLLPLDGRALMRTTVAFAGNLATAAEVASQQRSVITISRPGRTATTTDKTNDKGLQQLVTS